MLVNNVTSAFTHNGKPVANGSLTVYVDRTSTQLANLTANGLPTSNPVKLNSNGGIVSPIETDLGIVYCIVKNAAGAVLFGYELVSTAGVIPRWLPNTTDNPDSTGVTDSASISVKNKAQLNMSDEGKLNLSEGATIDFGSNTKLYARGFGAISGLQGNIRSGDAILHPSCRVYKIREDFNARIGLDDAAASFSPGDLFYFIAEKLLEGDAYVRYLDTDWYTNSAKVNQDVSAVLMLVDKAGEGENVELLFEKISDANLKANVIPTFNAEYNYTLEKEIGETFDIGFRYLGVGRVIEGQTLIYDKEGTIGVITKKINTHDGPIYNYMVISTSPDQNVLDGLQKQIDDEAQIRQEADEELQSQIDEIGSAIQPTGTEDQVMLGDGNPTPALDDPENPEETFNAASSLFNFKPSRDNAPRYVYGEFQNRGGYIESEKLARLLLEILIGQGLLMRPQPDILINSAIIRIPVPVNGNDSEDEAHIEDTNPNYTAGNVIWTPNHDIFNGTYSYTAVFSLIAKEGFAFPESPDILVNGAAPAAAVREEDGSMTITKNFAATMTALQAPNVTLANIATGNTRPKDVSGTNWTGAISWTTSPNSNVYVSGVNSGKFTLRASAGYRWNSSDAKVNSLTTNITKATLSRDGMELTFEWKTASLADIIATTPDISIPDPVFNAAKPGTSAVTKNDAAKNNYSINSLTWVPPGTNFIEGDATGKFELKANTGYIWGATGAIINTQNVPVTLNADKSILTASKTFNIANPTEGTFTDPRDGKQYPWKRMPDGKKWMTKNMEFAGYGIEHLYANMGRLYNWNQAKLVVPQGCHLPSELEWIQLFDNTGGFGPAGTAGKALKATSGWNSNGNGLDTYGFAALPAGLYITNFMNVKETGFWWSNKMQQENNTIYATAFKMTYKVQYVSDQQNEFSNYLSVRLIVD